jgi:hypothetical protein
MNVKDRDSTKFDEFLLSFKKKYPIVGFRLAPGYDHIPCVGDMFQRAGREFVVLSSSIYEGPIGQHGHESCVVHILAAESHYYEKEGKAFF